MEKRLLILSLAAAGLIVSGTSQANVSKPLEVMASVAATCSLDVTRIDFGQFNGDMLDATGEVRVNCNRGVPYLIAMDAGKGIDAGKNRNMKDSAGNKLPYRLTYIGANWGDKGLANTFIDGEPVVAVGKGAIEPFTVEGSIYATPNGAPSPGTYSDIVTVTVAF